MPCEFPEYTVTQWSSNPKIGGKAWVEGYEKMMRMIDEEGNKVGVIMGQPGMGKTAMLVKMRRELEERHTNSTFFMDMAGKDDLVEEFWRNEEMKRLKDKAFQKLSDKKKEIGYGIWAKIKKEFRVWLDIACDKNKFDTPFSYLFKLYCLPYSRDIDGMLDLLKDASEAFKVTILLDEVRGEDEMLGPLHRLLNSDVNVKLIITLIPGVLDSINDGALRRRLEKDSLKVVLPSALSDEDKKEIINVYCSELSEELSKTVNGSTVNELLINAREAYKNASKECSGRSIDCFKRVLSGYGGIKDAREASSELERKIRLALQEMKSEFGVVYVHDRGKRLSQGTVDDRGKRLPQVTPDIYFETKDKIFMGDIKITSYETVKDLENVKIMANMKQYKGVDGKMKLTITFVISNVDNMPLPSNVLIFKIEDENINRIINAKDEELLKREMKKILEKLGLKPV